MSKIKKYYPGFKLKALTFSFDDGTFQDIEMINMLDLLNLKATFNINSKLMGKHGDFTMDKWLLNYKINKKDIARIYKNHEVAAHSSTHSDFKDCSDENLKYEIDDDINNLSKLTRKKIVGFAYPYGIYNDKIINRLKENNIIYARSVDSNYSFNIPSNWYSFGGTCNISSSKLNSLVNRWNKNTYKSMKLFYIWGHSYELDMFHEHEKVYNILCKLANKEDVYYATNKDIFMYLDALNKLVYDKKKNKFINKSNYDLYIEFNNKKMIIKKEKKNG